MKTKKSKKKTPVVAFIIAIFALIVLIPILSSQNNIFTKIEFAELKENLKNEEFTFIYIGSPNCSHCTAMKPALSEIKEKYQDVNILYLDFSKLNSNQITELKSLNERLSQMGTPTFLFVKYGEIIGIKIGQTTTKEEFIDLFDSYYNEKSLCEEINAKEFITKFKSEETNVIFIGQSSCSHCEDFMPKINFAINKYGIKVYHINFDLLSVADKKALAELDKTFEKFGTPLTIITKNGKIVAKLSGDTTKEVLTTFLTDNKIIKGE